MTTESTKPLLIDTTIVATDGFMQRQKYGLKYDKESNQYELFFVDQTTHEIKRTTGATYPKDYVEQKIKDFSWYVVNPTDELISIIGVFNNVVSAEKMLLTTHTDYKEGLHHIGLTSYRGDITKSDYGGGGQYFHIGLSNTGNCQLSTIAYMCTILSASSDPREQLRQIYLRSSRKLLLCDINYYNFERLKQVVGEENIIARMRYSNTNGSDMISCIINISKL